MADYGRGAKAGVVAGLVAGVFLPIGYYALFSLNQDTIRTTIQNALPAGSVITVDQALAFALLVVVVGTFLGTVIAGVIFGPDICRGLRPALAKSTFHTEPPTSASQFSSGSVATFDVDD